MRTHIMLLMAIMICSVIYCQPSSEWAIQGGDNMNSDIGNAICTDSSGNTYVTGNLNSSGTFGSFTIHSDGDRDIYVAKLDINGNWLWATRAGGGSDDAGCDIALDNVGNLLVTGYFKGYADFGVTELHSPYYDSDVFVAKLDNNGNWLWAKRAGGGGSDIGHSVSTDILGNAYITGYSDGSASFGDTTLGRGTFIAKLSDNGNWIWATLVSNGNESHRGYGICTDDLGNSYVTGSYGSGAGFGANWIDGFGGTESNIFIAKIDTNGNWLWAKGAGGTYWDCGNDVALDSSGNVYFTGYFTGAASFGQYSLTGGTTNTREIFIAKLDTNGNWMWARRAGGSGDDYGSGVSIDSGGNCYITGLFVGTASFGAISLISTGFTDAYIAMLNSNGDWLWAKKAGGPNADQGYGLTTGIDDAVNVCGYFNGNGTIDSTTLSGYGSFTFVSKISPSTTITGFHSDVNQGLESLSVQFTDTSLLNPELVTGWLWEFGDGSESTEQNPLHIYQNDGMYSVSLTVYSIYGTSYFTTRPDYIIVLPRFPELEVAETSIDLGNVYLGSQSVAQDVWIKNIGTDTLMVESFSYFLTNTRFEVLGITLPLSIAEGDSTSIQLRFTPLISGDVTDSLYIHNNSTNLPIAVIQLKGRGEIVPPKPPQNVQIVMNGADAILSWDAVNQTIFDTPIAPEYYLVFTCPAGPDGVFVYNGATTGLQYTHGMVGMFSPYTFYHVVAYKHYARDGVDITDLGLKQGMTEAEVMERLSRQ